MCLITKIEPAQVSKLPSSPTVWRCSIWSYAWWSCWFASLCRLETNYTDRLTERRAAHSAETDHCIINSSGRRWWVSKAVSCHRNPQRTLQRKQHRKVEHCYFNSHPLHRHPPRTALQALWGRGWGRWVAGQCRARDKTSLSLLMLADEMCWKR